MGREKQIEEIFNIIVDGVIDGDDNNSMPTGNTCDNIARAIYNAGYRKENEVRKETAREILSRINEYFLDYNYDLKKEFEKLCKDYGLEAEE